MRYLIVAATLIVGCGCNGCGSNGSQPAAGGSPVNESTPTIERSRVEPADATSSERDPEAAQSASVSLPEYVDAPTLLVEIDKFGVRVSGGTWFKSLPKAQRREHDQDFKPKVVSAFRRLSPLKATGRTVGRSLFYPAVTGLEELLAKHAEMTGNREPVPVEYRVKRSVPFWLAARFANFLLWNDGVSHLQTPRDKSSKGLVIARTTDHYAASTSTCPQANALLRGNRALLFWLPAHPSGLRSWEKWDMSEWGPGKNCGPWSPADELTVQPPIVQPPKEGDGLLRPCTAWRADAADYDTSWVEGIKTLDQLVPEGTPVLLGNVNLPSKCTGD